MRDEKFGLVARKAGASVAEVVAVWAYLLEAASMNDEDRGNPGNLDFEAIDFALGTRDGLAAAIYGALQHRGMIESDDGRLSSWDKRQPKRERFGDDSSERVKALRQRKRHVTPCNANDSHVTARGEEIRGEEIQEGNKNAREADPPARPAASGIAPGITNHTPVTVAQTDHAPIAPDFQPEPRHRGFADLHGLDLDRQVADFVAHAQDNARTSANWSAAFDRWLNKAVELAQKQRRTGTMPRNYGNRPPEPTPEELRKEAELRKARTVIDCDLCAGVHFPHMTGDGVNCKPRSERAA